MTTPVKLGLFQQIVGVSFPPGTVLVILTYNGTDVNWSPPTLPIISSNIPVWSDKLIMPNTAGGMVSYPAGAVPMTVPNLQGKYKNWRYPAQAWNSGQIATVAAEVFVTSSTHSKITAKRTLTSVPASAVQWSPQQSLFLCKTLQEIDYTGNGFFTLKFKDGTQYFIAGDGYFGGTFSKKHMVVPPIHVYATTQRGFGVGTSVQFNYEFASNGFTVTWQTSGPDMYVAIDDTGTLF